MPVQPTNSKRATNFLRPIAIRMLFTGAFISLLGGALLLFGPHTPPNSVLRPEMAFHAIFTLGLVILGVGLLGTLFLQKK